MPLAGDFQPLGEKNVLYPLTVDVCEVCGILQVRDLPPWNAVFNDHYAYASSTIGSLVEHFEKYALETVTFKTGRKLLEVGCNDGVFLSPLKQLGFDVVGVDASDNVAAMARSRGLAVETAIFNEDSAKKLVSEHGWFDVVTCSNALRTTPT